MGSTGFVVLDIILEIVWKILALTEGVLDEWVNVIKLLDGNFATDPLTGAGHAVAAEVSNLIEKCMQLVEGILEGMGATTY